MAKPVLPRPIRKKYEKHKPEQILRKLHEADVMAAGKKTVAQICQALAISEQTLYRWRREYAGMQADEIKRLKQLEEENRRLKKLLAEAELDKAMLKELAEGNW